MSTASVALIPVFSVIMIGYVIRFTGLIADEEWPAIDHLCYYILFPVLIIKTLATADLSNTPVVSIAGAMVLAILAMTVLLIIAKKPLTRLFSLSDASYTSLFQGATRWNTWVALAIIAALYGDNGLTIASIGIVAMIPLLNILNVTVLSLYGSGEGGKKPSLALMLARNPFIIACSLGILINISPLDLPPLLLTAFDIAGRGALGVALLSVGAALRPTQLFGNFPAIAATGILRLLLMPALMIISGLALGISGNTLTIITICGAVPTAGAGYVLARKMGGDAELMASIITFQILAATLTLPLLIWIATRLSG